MSLSMVFVCFCVCVRMVIEAGASHNICVVVFAYVLACYNCALLYVYISLLFFFVSVCNVNRVADMLHCC